MKLDKFKNPYFIFHVIFLILGLPAILLMNHSITDIASPLQKIGSVFIFISTQLLSIIFIGLAFKKIGQHPLLATTGLLFSLIPTILYIALPDRINH